MQSPEMAKSPVMASVRWPRLVLVVAVAALVSALVAPAVSAQGSSGGFGDVPAGTYYSDAVALLDADGVLAGTGCAEGFCPGEVIDRKTMAVWLVRILDGTDPAAVTTSRFDDVDVSGFHAPFIERMADLEVTRGCGDLSGFCPHRAVTRAQMAVFLSRAFDLADGPDPGFGDVPSDAWYRADVDRLAASGITVGCGDGSNFCPGRDTTRAQMATFLARATGKIQTPERATRAPAVLVSSFTRPAAMDGSGAWLSPPERHVAYLANYSDGGWIEVGELYVAASDGSNLTKVASDVLGGESCGDGWCDIPAAQWSPDGSRFWYVTIESRDDQGEATSFSLRVAATDGTGTVQLTRDSPPINRSAYSGGWSPDSQHLAYIIEGTDSGLFVARADGTNPTRLTDGYLNWSDVAWSPDSRHIAYESYEADDRVLYAARADGTNVSELAVGDDGGEPWFYQGIPWWWSPDGSRIAYTNAGALYSVRADGSGTANIAQVGDLGMHEIIVRWSPDGSRIAYVADGELYSVRADGGGVSKLGDGAAYGGWSPDGSRIAYVADGELYTALADGSGTTNIAQVGDLGMYELRVRWSPDGRYIVYGPEEEAGHSLFIARADGSSPTRLAEDTSWRWSPPVWSPDGRHIAYEAGLGIHFGSLFTARADGADITKISDSVLRSVVWSPDSSRIAYLTFAQQGQEPEDYDPADRSTWPYYRASVEISGIDGASIAKLETPYTVQSSWPCDLLGLWWRPEGIEFFETWGGLC